MKRRRDDSPRGALMITALRLSSILLLAAASIAQAQKPRAARTGAQTIVFVCEHGTVKSVVASTWFNQLARQRHLAIRAVSRGTDLQSEVPAFVREGLRRDGLALGPFTPTALADDDLRRALAVVTFDRPAVAARAIGTVPVMAWNGLPAVSVDYGIARDSIRARVTALVDSLARTKAARTRSR